MLNNSIHSVVVLYVLRLSLLIEAPHKNTKQLFLSNKEMLSFKSIFLRFPFKLFTQGDFVNDFSLVFPLLIDNVLLMIATRELAWPSLSILLACQNFLFILLIKCQTCLHTKLQQISLSFSYVYEVFRFPNSPKLQKL